MSLTAVEAQGTARSQPTHGTHLEMVTSPTPALLCLHLFSRQAVAVWGKKKKTTVGTMLEEAKEGSDREIIKTDEEHTGPKPCTASA